MPSIQSKIAGFVNKAQTKIRELAVFESSNFDYQGYQSEDSAKVLLQLYETRDFVRLLASSDRGGMTDKEINDMIDFFSGWLELNKVPFVSYPNLTQVIQSVVIYPDGSYALQADLLSEIQARMAGDSSLQSLITAVSNTLIAHLNGGPDKHAISEITGLTAALAAAAASAGTDGREVELQGDGDVIEWRYVGDPTWIPLGNFKGDDGREIQLQGNGDVIEWRYVGEVSWTSLGSFQGDDGLPFEPSFRGPSAGRLNNAFDGEDEHFTYLEEDTGYVYWRNPVGGPATVAEGWDTPVQFHGRNGWSPVLGAHVVSSIKVVHEVVSWVGGQGDAPPSVGWYVGPGGLTDDPDMATNILGPVGPAGTTVIGAEGDLAGRDAYDNEDRGFMYLLNTVSPQVVYQKNSDAAADWVGPYAWQGSKGDQGDPGAGLGYLINQAAHGLVVFRGVAFRGGAFVQYDSSLDSAWLGITTNIGSSSLATLVQAGFVSGLSGLTANTLYYLQDNGTVTITISTRPIFFAISTTTGFVLAGGNGGGGGDAHTRSQIIASSASVTANTDNYDLIDITALAVDVTINNPTGAARANGDFLIYRIKDNGAQRDITWGSHFREVATALIPSTIPGEIHYLPFCWNANDTKWDSIGGAVGSSTEVLSVSCSNLTSSLVVSTNVGYYRMPYAMTLTQVKASVLTAPTGANLIVDIKKNGVTVLSTLLSIDAGEKTSVTATTPAVISVPALAADDEITIDITQIGSTVAGVGLIVTLVGVRQ